jgi:hypothetical protein
MSWLVRLWVVLEMLTGSSIYMEDTSVQPSIYEFVSRSDLTRDTKMV